MKALCVRQRVPRSDALMSPSDELYDSVLTEGEWYTIYGVWFEQDKIFYLIHRAEDIYYPLLTPATCFDAPVGPVPDLFRFSFQALDDVKRVILSSPLFSTHPYLYESLLEGEYSDPLVAEWTKFRTAVDAHSAYCEYRDQSF